MTESTSKLASSRQLRRHQVDEQRERILAAAETLFLRHGLEATRMVDIAAEARITKVTLYRYFPNRDVIAAEILARVPMQIASVLGSGSPAFTREGALELARSMIRHFDALRDALRLAAMIEHRVSQRSFGEVLAESASDRAAGAGVRGMLGEGSEEVLRGHPQGDRFLMVMDAVAWFLERLALDAGQGRWHTNALLVKHLLHFEEMIVRYIAGPDWEAPAPLRSLPHPMDARAEPGELSGEASMDTSQPAAPRAWARNLRTEYLENPLGIDAVRPRLGWQIAGTAGSRGVSQAAFQVQAAAEQTAFACGAGLLWDSGKVQSDKTQGIAYGGPELVSRERVCWRVRVWDQDDLPSAWSETASWEMGLLAESDWTAEWIEVGWDEDPKAFKPCPYFRRTFTLPSPAKSARLYVTSHGLYEAWLNGERVGDQLFSPGYTPYDRMLQYQVYDVTRDLNVGENVLGAILGDGWYRGKVYLTGSRNVYGTRLALLALLRVEMVDGQTVTVATGPDWHAATGPILKSDMKDGEVYDARLEMPGWSMPGFRACWQAVRVANHSKKVLVASMGVSVRRKETFKPTVIRTPMGETVLDFGQNLAGVVHFRVRGQRGTTVRLRHGEALGPEGNFTTANLHVLRERDPDRHPFQEVRYTLKGEGSEEYEPRFTVHGFRYVKVEGYPGDLHPDDFYSVALYSDMPPAGRFECSDPLVTRLHKNTEWSMKSNFLDLPTDCPQRERAGWTGDAQIFCPSASFLMDTRAFFRKWLRQLALEQSPSGKVGNFVPNPYRLLGGRVARILGLLDGSAGWGDSAVIIPWALYQAYGDKQILEDQYESMKAWVGYMQRRASRAPWWKGLSPRSLASRERRARRHLIWDVDYHWGEWLEPGDGSPLRTFSGMAGRLLFGAPVVATAYYAHSTRILANTAEVLGKSDDAQYYHALAERVKAAYAAQFIGPDGRIEPDKQASYVRTLAFGLAPEECRQAIVERLVRLVRAAGNHVGTGFLSTVFLCDVLAESGRLDVAYDLLTQKTIPSWLYPITKGATTIWETWEGIDELGRAASSLNHYSPGAVIGFLHRVVVGIRAAEPGYRRISIHPRPGGGLTGASATFESVHGPIAAAWKQEEGGMRVQVTIPANTRATVTLPRATVSEVTESGAPVAQVPGVTDSVQDGADAHVEVGSGEYCFEYSISGEEVACAGSSV